MKTIEKRFNNIMTSNVFRTDGPEIDLTAALIVLAQDINAADSESINWDLGEGLESTLNDLIIGAFWACTECHGGQFTDVYECLCVLGTVFSPGMSCGPEPETGEHTAYKLISEHLLNLEKENEK